MGTDPRVRFDRVASAWLGVVESLTSTEWQAPALGTWNARELVGHTLRAFLTIEHLLDHPGGEASTPTAGEYYRAAMATPGVHDAVAARGVEAAIGLGDDPVGFVRTTVDATLARLATASLDIVGPTAAGTMRLEDYLDTRIVEVAVHLDDLCCALGRPTPDLGDTWGLVAGAIVASATPKNATTAVRAVLGRGALPEGFNLLG